MLAGLRRGLKNPLVLGLLALLGLAFAFTGFELAGPVGGASGDEIAEVDGEAITSTQVQRDAEQRVRQARQQDPRADIAQLVAAGGVEAIVNQLIAQRAARAFADEAGFVVSKAQVDGEIASIPAFRGLTGQFDADTFRQRIAAAGLTEAEVRDEFAGLILQRQLVTPIIAGARAPRGLAEPYAAMLAETREGTVGAVPANPDTVRTQPTDAQLAAFLTENRARYLVPERRVVSYALIGPGQVRTAAPSDADVQAFYERNAQRFAGSEARVLSQVILPTEAAARQFAQRVASGASFVDAARAAGFSAADISIGPQTREAFTRLSAANVAQAAFAAPDGGTTAPVRSPLGFHVVRVDEVRRTGGKSLDQARPEIVAELTRQRTDEGVQTLVDQIEDEISDGATVAEVAQRRGLELVTTPPITAGGQAPSQPQFRPAPELVPLLPAAFSADPEDDATLEAIPGGGGGFALLGVGDVVEAAPPPLAQVRPQLVQDWRSREALRQARATAEAIAAKVNRGVPMAQAFREAGVAQAPRDLRARRLDVAQPNSPPPPPLTLLFQLPQGRARVLPQGEAGVFVVQHRRTVPAQASDTPGLAEATRNQFGQSAGDEYAEQFVRAMERQAGVERNPAAVARLKRQLDGSAARN